MEDQSLARGSAHTSSAPTLLPLGPQASMPPTIFRKHANNHYHTNPVNENSFYCCIPYTEEHKELFLALKNSSLLVLAIQFVTDFQRLTLARLFGHI